LARLGHGSLAIKKILEGENLEVKKTKTNQPEGTLLKLEMTTKGKGRQEGGEDTLKSGTRQSQLWSKNRLAR